MNGQLNEHPLGELIREISTAGISGALRLTHERIKLVVYTEAGEMVFAASNLRLHRLSESLKRWGLVSEQQLAQVGEKPTDHELAAALVAAGALNPEALEDVWARQVADALRPALLWTHGAWAFDPRVRLAGTARARVELNEMLMESARRLPAEFVARRFKDRRNERLLPADNPPEGLELLPAEAFVLSRVDVPLSVYDLVTISGLPEADALRAVYALASGGYLRREPPPQAFTPEAIRKALAINAAQAKRAASETPDQQLGVVEEKSAPLKQPPAPVEEEVDERRELEEMFARLERATNYYHVLGVSRSASPDIIKRTYHGLARRFHPDRFHHEEDTGLHARVEDAFARIAQAYETLKDRQARAVYDMKIEREGNSYAKESPKPKQAAPNVKASPPVNENAQASQGAPATSSSSPKSTFSTEQRAEDIFKQGVIALQKGNSVLAITLIGEAARLVPRQPRYRAYYGRALAANPQTHRQAETEFQAAINLDAGNAAYRVMLAEFYRDLGFQRRAQGELERALSIDPRNVAARQLLDKLK
jgi:tetratricopeptide (TPR) repeat protein